MAEYIVYIDRENLTSFHIKLQFLSILTSCFIQIRSKIDPALRIFSSRRKYKAEMVPNLNEPCRNPKNTICQAVQNNKIFKPSERIYPPESFWPDSRQLFIPNSSRLCYYTHFLESVENGHLSYSKIILHNLLLLVATKAAVNG